MLQPEPFNAQHQGARCAEHVDRPASVICTRCGGYACNLCRNEGPDGLEYCDRCVPLVSAVVAEPGTRLVAHIVDNLVTMLPFIGLMIVGIAVGASTGARKGGSNEGGIVMLLSMGLGMMGTLAVLGYQFYLLVQTGQTLGKRMMRIKVVRTDGSPADFVRVVLLRSVVPYAINFACGIFSLVDALFIFGADRRTLHDQIADTKVVKVDERAG
jgi:uncharacterized RDD family membrane protein YckC